MILRTRIAARSITQNKNNLKYVKLLKDALTIRNSAKKAKKSTKGDLDSDLLSNLINSILYGLLSTPRGTKSLFLSRYPINTFLESESSRVLSRALEGRLITRFRINRASRVTKISVEITDENVLPTRIRNKRRNTYAAAL